MEGITIILMEDVLNHIVLGYLVSTILVTFTILSYVITKPSKLVKILVHLVVGCIIGTLWYYLNKVVITDLVLTFSLTYIAYSLVVKTICDKFNVKYDNGIGITQAK